MSDEKSLPHGSAQWYELISAHLDGVVSEADEHLLNRLLSENSDFSAEFQSLQRLQRVLAQYRQALPPAPPTILQAVMEHVDQICAPVCSLEEVVEYVDGVASEDVRLRIEQRMAADAVFRQEVLEYKALSAVIANSAAKLGDGFAESIVSSLSTDATTEVPPPPEPWLWRVLAPFLRRSWVPRYGIVALAAVLLISGWWVMSFTQRSVLQAPALDAAPALPERPYPADFSTRSLRPAPKAPADPAPALGAQLLEVAWRDFQQLRTAIEAYRRNALEKSLVVEKSQVSDASGREKLERGRDVELPDSMDALAARGYEGAYLLAEPDLVEAPIKVSGYVGSMVAWKGDDHRLHCAVIVDMEVARETIRVLCQRYNVGLESVESPTGGRQGTPEQPPAGEGELIVLDLPRSAADSLLQDIAHRLASKDTPPNRSPAFAGSGRPRLKARARQEERTYARRLAVREQKEQKALESPPHRMPYRGIAIELPRTRVDDMRQFLSSLGPMRPLLERVVTKGSARSLLRPFAGAWGNNERRDEDSAPAARGPQTKDEDRVRVFLYLIGEEKRIPAENRRGEDRE